MGAKEDAMEDCEETEIAVEGVVEEVDMNDIGFQETLALYHVRLNGIPCTHGVTVLGSYTSVHVVHAANQGGTTPANQGGATPFWNGYIP
jgi:hypothetical protein